LQAELQNTFEWKVPESVRAQARVKIENALNAINQARVASGTFPRDTQVVTAPDEFRSRIQSTLNEVEQILRTAVNNPQVQQNPRQKSLFSDVLSMFIALQNQNRFEVSEADSEKCQSHFGSGQAYATADIFDTIALCPEYFASNRLSKQTTIIHEVIHMLGANFYYDERRECQTEFLTHVLLRAAGKPASRSNLTYVDECAR